MRYVATALALFTLMMAAPAAACPEQDANGTCVTEISAKVVPARKSDPGLTAGDLLPDDAMVMINTGYYGLPPARDGWWYFKVDGQIYRADADSRVILERVTHLANAAFRS